MTTYYVKSGGNDSFSGTSDETAWAYCPGMSSWSGSVTLSAGDIVYFRSQDTWQDSTPPVLLTKEGVTYNGSTYGTGTRATLQVTGSDTGHGSADIFVGNVVLKDLNMDGNGYAVMGINIGYNISMLNDIENITIDGCHIYNGRDTDEGNQYYYGILVSQRSQYTTRNVTIKNCIVHDTAHEGISIYPAWAVSGNKVDTVLVQNCEIYNTGRVSGYRGNPVDITNDVANVTIEYNNIHDCSADAGFAICSYDPYDLGSPTNVIVRYNIMEGVLIALNSYFDNLGIDGNGEIYCNLLIDGGFTFAESDLFNGSWKFYNNTVYNPSNIRYCIAGSYNKAAMNTSGVEIRNNIFYSSNRAVVNDWANTLSEMVHTNNLYYRSDSSSVVINNSVLSNANAVPSTSVSVTHDINYTYFTKSGGTDWTTVFSVGQWIRWSGFNNDEFNDRNFEITSVSADVLRVYNIILGVSGPTETTVVTGQKWVNNAYNLSQVTTWEPSGAQNTDPLFVDAANRNLKVQANSPCIGAGIDMDLIKDYSGRLVKNVPDIGAYEYQVGSTSLFPINFRK